ncbi:hypothetical protein DVH24_023480 [Malus domestica]|uniref:Uncharacterized protein n=1 Tax=Malus domestica TaxID=3750 RepID=A0A498I0R6_MALDO|nr:hypothetical protein DVH24_023480 [Malus domestica]
MPTLTYTSTSSCPHIHIYVQLESRTSHTYTLLALVALGLNKLVFAFVVLLIFIASVVFVDGYMGVHEKGAGLVQDEAAKTIQTNSFKTKREKNLATGQDLVLLVMDYTPARRKTPIHN